MNAFDELNRRFQLQEEYLGLNKPVNITIPLVSVCVITYQHVNYITECLDGILMQKTNFSFEIIVGEDESTDGTRQICIEYARRYPDKIRLFLRDRKLSQYYENDKFSSRFNGIWTRMSARGKYIALCEGDDYWTNAYKLQKQVDFLENNPSYALCCGGYESYNEVTNEKLTINKANQSLSEAGFSFGLNETQGEWLIKTLTVVFHNKALSEYYKIQYKFCRDIHLFYHLLKEGKGYYFNLIFGVYRIHSGGINSMHYGKVNFNTAYNCYKELHEQNGDAFTREAALRHILLLFNYDLYNTYKGNTLQKRISLFFSALYLARGLREYRWIVTSFIPLKIKNLVNENVIGLKKG